MREGRIVLLSGPSDSGKGTLVQALLDREGGRVRLSVSATTRAPRPGETHGVQYYFYSHEQFRALIERGEMLEYAEYCGNFYGTPRGPVEQALAAGQDVILEIEVQGALQVKAKCPQARMIFVVPPSAAELERRLRGRGTEADEVIRKRLRTAHAELAQAGNYDYILVNGDLQAAVEELAAAIRSEETNVQEKQAFIKGVLNDVDAICD